MPDTTPSADMAAAKSPANAYDEVLYVGFPFANTHPDRLATLAILHGIAAAPVLNCRVLEIGCGDGANLVPMAATLPSAQFTGVDYAARPVARAQQMVDDLALRNVRIMQCDLRDIPADAGTFDYVIVHGVYSWIPPEVRAQLMPVIARHLAPNGIAYVSYNIFPGCRVRQAAWDMLKFHTQDCPDLKSKLAAARALIALMVDSEGPVNRDEQTLRAEFRKLADRPDGALCHDDLSDVNHPVYFREFLADAAGSDLTFLVEADLFSMTAGDFAPNVRDALGAMDRLTREQYLDFLRFRPFRCSLICHVSALPEFRLFPARAREMHASPTLSVRQVLAAGKTMKYQDEASRTIMEVLLARWPNTIPVMELVACVAATLPQSGAAVPSVAALETLLVELCIASLVDLRTRPVAPARVAGERPIAFAPARWISRDNEIVPNLYHDGIRLSDAIARQLVGLLDGTRTRADLMRALGEACATADGAQQLEAALTGLAKRAMLVA